MRHDIFSEAELTSRALLMLQGKWKAHILLLMKDRPVRLGWLRKTLPFASKKALGTALKQLVADDIVVRRDLSRTTLHVEYHIRPEKRDAVLNTIQQLVRLTYDLELISKLNNH